MRIAATAALFERRDVLIVASVSCIYGLGSPESFGKMAIEFEKGARYGMTWYLKRLVEAQYERTSLDLERGGFRVRGDVLEIQPSYEDLGLRVEFFGDEIDRITRFELVTGKTLEEIDRFELFPKSHYVTPEEIRKRALGSIEAELVVRLEDLQAQNKLLEAQRLEQRTRFDLEMMREIGYCAGHRELLAPSLGTQGRASRRPRSSTTSRRTTSRSSTRATRRSRSSAPCTTATSPARARSWSTASGSRPLSTTAR